MAFDPRDVGAITGATAPLDWPFRLALQADVGDAQAAGGKRIGNGKPDARTRTRDENFFQDVEKGFAPRNALRVAATLIPILIMGSMQECPAQQCRYCASHDRDSSESKISILSQCCC